MYVNGMYMTTNEGCSNCPYKYCNSCTMTSLTTPTMPHFRANKNTTTYTHHFIIFFCNPEYGYCSKPTNDICIGRLYGGYRQGAAKSKYSVFRKTLLWWENKSNVAFPWYAPNPLLPTPPKGRSWLLIQIILSFTQALPLLVKRKTSLATWLSFVKTCATKGFSCSLM